MSKLAICTVEELAGQLAKIVCADWVRNIKFPGCDFAVIFDEDDDLEYVKSKAEGWYGVKAVDTGFNSEDLILFSDYYGGGCAAFAQSSAADKFGSMRMAMSLWRRKNEHA